MNIKIINKSNNPLPAYGTSNSAGMDIMANLDFSVVLKPGDRTLIPTGIFIELPMGFEAQIRPRSGLAIKHGITVLNSPGTIDSDYRGEVGIILINHSEDDFIINHGDRICQMIITRHEIVEWDIVDNLISTDRGDGGFGHTGN